MSFKVVDGNKIYQPYVNLQVVIADKMSVQALAVYYELKSIANWQKKNGEMADLSIRQIAKVWKIGINKVRAAVHDMEKLGIIIVQKGFGRSPDCYTLIDEDWAWRNYPNPELYGSWRANNRWK